MKSIQDCVNQLHKTKAEARKVLKKGGATADTLARRKMKLRSKLPFSYRADSRHNVRYHDCHREGPGSEKAPS